MNILVLTLLLLIFINCEIFADQNTLTANYPVSSVSYNKVILNSPQPANGSTQGTNINCADPNTNNAGLIFQDPNSGNLEICVAGQNSPQTIQTPPACFNRFCTEPINGNPCIDLWTTSTGSNQYQNTCPTGFAPVEDPGGNPVVDSFTTPNKTNIANPTKTVYSIICCQGGINNGGIINTAAPS